MNEDGETFKSFVTNHQNANDYKNAVTVTYLCINKYGNTIIPFFLFFEIEPSLFISISLKSKFSPLYNKTFLISMSIYTNIDGIQALTSTTNDKNTYFFIFYFSWYN